MKYQLRMKVSPGAAFFPREHWMAIIKEAMIQAEQMKLGPKDFAIFDENVNGLKVVIDWGKMEAHVMTKDEADQAGLPDKPSSEPSAN